MARAVRVSFKRFLFHNKTTIFLTILFIVIVIFLPLQMKDTQSYHRKAIREPQPPDSKSELDAYYKLVLGVSPSNTTKEVECKNVWMFAAIPGFDIEDYVWEYLSLIAIEEVYGESVGRQTNAFLSKRSIEELGSIFER